jgi:hypothetical protein
VSAQWDGKVVMSTPGGPAIEMSLGEYLAWKDAEIERLTRERYAARAEIERLRADNERLREVIRTILARCVEMDDSDAVSETLDIASAALEGKP